MAEADEIVRLLVDCLKEVTAEQAGAGQAAVDPIYSSSSPTADAENTLPSSGGTSRKRTATEGSSQDLPVQVPTPISSNPPKRVKYDI